MVKQGGKSYKGTKPGVRNKFSCQICGRDYKQSYTMQRHLKNCTEFNKN